MTPENFKSIEDFILFSKAATTRSGTPFICEVFAIEQKKTVTAKGKVFVKGVTADVEMPIEMEWNLEGKALNMGEQFDLIQEEPFNTTE